MKYVILQDDSGFLPIIMSEGDTHQVVGEKFMRMLEQLGEKDWCYHSAGFFYDGAKCRGTSTTLGIGTMGDSQDILRQFLISENIGFVTHVGFTALIPLSKAEVLYERNKVYSYGKVEYSIDDTKTAIVTELKRNPSWHADLKTTEKLVCFMADRTYFPFKEMAK